MRNFSDEELINLAREGNQEAAKTLVGRYSRPLFGFIYRYVGQRELAEDLFQNTFCNVVKSWHSYQERGNFKAWLFRIAQNQVKDYFKKNHEEALSEEMAEKLGSLQPDVLSRLVTRERYTQALEIIGQLPPNQKTVFLLRMEGGLSFKEIAATLNCPLNTALAHMRYAVEKLRKGLESDEKK